MKKGIVKKWKLEGEIQTGVGRRKQKATQESKEKADYVNILKLRSNWFKSKWDKTWTADESFLLLNLNDALTNYL